MPSYRPSRYNSYVNPDESRVIVYNALTNCLVTLAPDEYKAVKECGDALETLGNDKVSALLRARIIVEEDLDEVELVRLRLNKARFASRALTLTLIPTMACNLACTYCYEGNPQDAYMDPETEDATVSFAAGQIERQGYRAMSVSWFGGEPLLRPEILYSLSRKLMALCESKGVTYSALVVTNGTNLNRELVRRLLSYNVSNLQITIDGPKDVHDPRRPFKILGGSSFEVIAANIDDVLGMIPIQVRMNVDKTNHHRILEFVDLMTARGWFKPKSRCSFYLGYTREWTPACKDISSQYFTLKEFSQVEHTCQMELTCRGFDLGNLYPAHSGYCTAACGNGFVVGPGGELYKCWADVNTPDERVGNVRHPVDLTPRLMKWLAYDPLSDGSPCRACRLLPICAGGCPSTAIRRQAGGPPHHMCSPWKFLMERKMDLFLEQQARAEATTRVCHEDGTADPCPVA